MVAILLIALRMLNVTRIPVYLGKLFGDEIQKRLLITSRFQKIALSFLLVLSSNYTTTQIHKW